MKILLVHELFMPDQVGGGEVLVYELAKGLIKKGHEVKVFTTGKPEIKQYENIPTVRININRYLFNFSFLKIKKLAKDYDIIQSFSYNAAFPSYLASKLGKKPVICTILGVYGKTWKKLRKLSFFWRMMEKVQLNRKFNATVFLSPLSREIGHEIGMKMAPNFIIPSGVNLSNTHPNLKKEKFVLFVGRLSKQKGLDFIFEYISNYQPDIGKIHLTGHVVYMEKEDIVDEVLKGWEKGKKLSKEMMGKIYNAVLTRCNIQSLIMSRDINLPPNLPMPKVKTDDK